MLAILYDYRHITTPINRRVRHGHRFRSRRHPFRRSHAAGPLHGRVVASQRPQARLPRDRRCAGAGHACARADRRGFHGQRIAGRTRSATGATTINKVCGSGMKATMLAHDIIHAGSASIVLSGGMESMSNAPYLLAKARGGYRAGHDRIIDHMMMDGLEDAYETGRSMGDFGSHGGSLSVHP